MVHIKDGKEEATFQGSFLNGFRKHGTYSTKDGTIEYVGSFTEGDLRHGKGVFFARGYYKYDGDWKLDKRDGKGKCSYDNGAGEYEGSWKDDMRHGKGIMFIPNEYEYDGAWKEDREEGKGTAKYLKTNEKYVGMFKESVPSGYGKRLYSDGSIYEGEFENGVRSGRGGLRTKETDRNTEASGKAIRKTGTVRVNLAMELFSEASGKMIRGYNRPRVLRIRKSSVMASYPPWPVPMPPLASRRETN